MALIYASAVNKRLHPISRRKRSTTESPTWSCSQDRHYHQPKTSVTNIGGMDTLIDLTRDISIDKDTSIRAGYCNPSCTCVKRFATSSTKEIERPRRPHSIRRSHTSCEERFKRKDQRTVNDNLYLRKISTPVMSQTASLPLSKSPCTNQKKHNHKKHLIQKYNLELGKKVPEGKTMEESRHTSLSLDADDWVRKLAEAEDDDDHSPHSPNKLGAFQKMKNKFVQWRSTYKQHSTKKSSDPEVQK